LAIRVARREGVNRTAQQLHLDAGKLRWLLVAADGGRRQRRRPPRFVELIASAPTATPGCVIEFESAGGCKMRIHWQSVAPLDKRARTVLCGGRSVMVVHTASNWICKRCGSLQKWFALRPGPNDSER